LLQGALVFALVSAIYVLALQRGLPINEVRALTYFSLVISIVALIFVNRSNSASLVKAIWRPNKALAFVLPVVAATLALTLLWPAASGLFGFGPLHADDLALTFGAGAVILVVLELFKALWRVVFVNRPRIQTERTFTQTESATQ
jgi:P-type Ca2+ transporter type 2C